MSNDDLINSGDTNNVFKNYSDWANSIKYLTPDSDESALWDLKYYGSSSVEYIMYTFEDYHFSMPSEEYNKIYEKLLAEELEDAIENEDYERAAEIRDELNKIKKK